MSHSTEIRIEIPCIKLLVVDLTRDPAERLNIYAGKERTYRNEDAVAAYKRVSCKMSRRARRCMKVVIERGLEEDREFWPNWLTITVKHCE